MAKLDELHNYAYPDKYLDELHIYDGSAKNNGFDEVHNYGNRGVTYGMDELHLYGSYQTVEEDEVNQPKERQIIDIDEYFDEIEAIDEQQKEDRKELAEEFKDILQLLFALILADLRVGNEINEGFYHSLAKSRFMDAVDHKLPYLTIDIHTQIENYINQNLTYIIESTVRNQGNSYFFSETRATAVAVDDSMATFNLEELDEAIRAGYKYKIWKAMDDNRVRLDHQKVDGEKVAIDKPFEVGRCLMQAPMIFDKNSVFQDAKQVINCRCSLIYSNKGIEENTKSDKIDSNKRLSISTGEDVPTTRIDHGQVALDKIEDTIKEYQEKIRDESVEHAIVIDKKGNVVEFVGGNDTVNIDGVDLDGAHVLHNHPASNGILSFGEDDFDFIRDNQSATYELCNSKYDYKLNVIKDMSELSYNRAYGMVTDDLADLYAKNEDYQHKVMEALRDNGYIEYNRIPKG